MIYDKILRKKQERKMIAKLGYPIKQGKQIKVNSLSEIIEDSLDQSDGPFREQHVRECEVLSDDQYDSVSVVKYVERKSEMR